MSHKPSWLEEQQIHLSNDSTALVSYDREADILEITFQDAAASATVELTDGVYLRFDRQSGQPLSLGFVNFTPLTQQQEFGIPLLSLTGLAKLPQVDLAVILKMLQTLPVNAILHLYSFKPTARTRVMPVASLIAPSQLTAINTLLDRVIA